MVIWAVTRRLPRRVGGFFLVGSSASRTVYSALSRMHTPPPNGQMCSIKPTNTTPIRGALQFLSATRHLNFDNGVPRTRVPRCWNAVCSSWPPENPTLLVFLVRQWINHKVKSKMYTLLNSFTVYFHKQSYFTPFCFPISERFKIFNFFSSKSFNDFHRFSEIWGPLCKCFSYRWNLYGKCLRCYWETCCGMC